MATGPITQLSDIVEPTQFARYIQLLTEQKARLIQSGVLVRNPVLDAMLAGGGLTFNVPAFNDLDDDADNVSGQDPADIQVASFENGTPTDANRKDAVPAKTDGQAEVAVRLNRNKSWSSADIAAQLAGADPMASVAGRVSFYWQRRLQAAFVATQNGVIADNTANDAGDYSVDISGGAFIDGVTNFSAEAFIDAATTLGDSAELVTAVMVHSVVYARMQKNNLIDFIPDSEGRVTIPTFLGRQVIVDDGMPVTGQVYDSWLFGANAMQIGVGSPKVATEVHREPLAGNGGGQEVLTTRQEWTLHPTGHAYTGSTTAKGGPTNTVLAQAASWNRVYPERKQVRFARLVTREA